MATASSSCVSAPLASVPISRVGLSPNLSKRSLGENDVMSPDAIEDLKKRAVIIGSSIVQKLQANKRSKSEGQNIILDVAGKTWDHEKNLGRSVSKHAKRVRSLTPFARSRFDKKSSRSSSRHTENIASPVRFGDDNIEDVYDSLGRQPTPRTPRSASTVTASSSTLPRAARETPPHSIPGRDGVEREAQVQAHKARAKTKCEPQSMASSWEFIPEPAPITKQEVIDVPTSSTQASQSAGIPASGSASGYAMHAPTVVHDMAVDNSMTYACRTRNCKGISVMLKDYLMPLQHGAKTLSTATRYWRLQLLMQYRQTHKLSYRMRKQN